MKKDIILAGVGGQGILSIAAVIGYAAIDMGLFIKQAEVHGMSQRGGDVSSNLRISDREIYSDLIPGGKADLIISVEPMESLRYVPMLSPDGWLITNSEPFINIPNYPELQKIHDEIIAFPRHILIEADKMAKEINAAKSANMIILGASSPFLGIEFDKFEKAVAAIFRKKGDEVIQTNLNALKIGREFAMANMQ
ncbi:MAG: indolepyruvate oxidoreductase subunit beta [Bacteroidales bacterium]|jgi:indolepyruvate ferredoxin oxidoreductase beta subunit|nr:indolepyruvate oxidoreductase subunit beta [Bacteroidales bacterium]MDD4214240.1 indolepyruvate oxidoreductase subunit beta [Bacteroidales bacterium]